MFLFITLLITMILGGAEVDLFTPAFPELMHTFQLTPFTLQLIMSLNFVGYCSGCLVTGFLGDRYGPHNVILMRTFWGGCGGRKRPYETLAAFSFPITQIQRAGNDHRGTDHGM